VRVLILTLAALALASCASVQKLDAANDVHKLLLSIRDNDRATFDAHVDREALKGVIEAKVTQEASKDKRYGGLAAVFAPALADFAGDTLLQPEVFKSVAAQYGYTADTKIPGAVAISSALKTLPDGRVCATRKKDGPCVLVFTKEAGVWKLTGFEGDMSLLKLKG
jgi:hypothetical protein